MCGGKSLYCGCFGMPQTESSDCCGCPPPPPCMPKCGRPPPCCRKGGKQSCKDNIVCYIPKSACKHQQQGPSCCKNRPPVLQCVKFPRAPGCVPMTCEPLPDCPNKFICRPINMHCPRTKTCLPPPPPPPPPRPVSLSCRSNCSSASPRATSGLPPCPPALCAHKKPSPSATKCESTTSREELKQRCDKQPEKKTPKCC